MAKILDIHLPNNITNALSRELGSDKTREFTMSDGGYILPRGYLSVLLQECAAALDAQTLGIFNGETWKYNVSMIDDDPLGQNRDLHNGDSDRLTLNVSSLSAAKKSARAGTVCIIDDDNDAINALEDDPICEIIEGVVPTLTRVAIDRMGLKRSDSALPTIIQPDDGQCVRFGGIDFHAAAPLPQGTIKAFFSKLI